MMVPAAADHRPLLLVEDDDDVRDAMAASLRDEGYVVAEAENGRLAQNFEGYAAGLDALARSLGPAWKHTVVVAVTEFGRTVAVNGSGGTDHGTASVVLVMGGAVRGGKLRGDWPGLDRLEENRDLRVATDARSVLKGVLRDHLGIDAATLDRKVFPDAPGAKPMDGLVRA